MSTIEEAGPGWWLIKHEGRTILATTRAVEEYFGQTPEELDKMWVNGLTGKASVSKTEDSRFES